MNGIGLTGAALGLAAQSSPAQTSQGSVPGGRTFDVRAFGAAGDGKQLDTAAVNQAIEAAAAAGGGTVHFPAGSYLCYSIRLKSNIALYLDAGATIVAADSPAAPASSGAYDLAEPNAWDHYQDYGHSHWRNSLLWGEGLQNVSILGPGLIWGRGLSRGHGPGPIAEQAGTGNKSISLKNCRNVLLRDFSILHGGHFGILATGVDNLTIDNLTIDTNRDGMDVDCCRNVRISNCSVNSPADDAICLKSSYGLGYARSTEAVTITNCYVTGGYEEGTLLDGSFKRIPTDRKVFRCGRIKFGTESNGGFKNITITNCVFEDCHGLALETVDGALLEDVAISNITMRDIASAPIFMRLGSRMRGPADATVGRLRRVRIGNLVVSNPASPYACILSGIPGHSIEDIGLHDILIQHPGGGTGEMARIEPAEKENAYPEPTMFGPMPAYGLYARHVKNISLSNVELTHVQEDARPAFFLNDVEDADFFHVKAQTSAGASTFTLKDVHGLTIAYCKPVRDAQLKDVKSQTL